MIAFNRSPRYARHKDGYAAALFGAMPSDDVASRWLTGLLAAWDEVDEAAFELTNAALGTSLQVPEWAAFADEAITREVARWSPDPVRPALVFLPAWRERLEPQLEQEGGRLTVLRRLVTFWMDHPDPRLTVRIVRLARRMGLWQQLAVLWTDHLRGLDRRDLTEAIGCYRGIPDEARRRFPMLTWASSVAAMHRVKGRAGPCPLARLLMRDAMALHSQWYLHEDVDSRVLGGTLWMSARWMLPSERPAEAVEVAWRTRMAIKDVIAQSEGRDEPRPLTQVIFRTFSAQLALARSDLQTASAEARQAGILGARDPGLRSLATGIELVSGFLLGVGPTPRYPTRFNATLAFPGLGDLRDTGLAMMGLASGMSALGRLDREGVLAVLDAVPAAAVAGGGLWSIRAFLVALYGALWGDPGMTLEQLDSSAAGFACTVAEDAEPLARRLVGNARVVLLNMVGATDAAREAVQFLAEDNRALAQARAHLWAGEMEEAARAAGAGLLDPRTLPRDRAHLLATRAAALCLDPAATEATRRAAARAAVARCWATECLLAIALLPASAREALLETFESNGSARDRALAAQTRSRLSQLSVGVDRDLVRIRLTGREQVLLPLLATTEPVPDIAKRLHLSTNTVRKQVVTLRAKFGAGSRAELVRNAREAGLLR